MTCHLCDRAVHARALCENHYRRVLRAERPKDPGPALEQRRTAAANARRARTTRSLERLEDLAELLDYGEWPPRAVSRLGWSVNAAIEAAERRGRTDITSRLNPYRKEAA